MTRIVQEPVPKVRLRDNPAEDAIWKRWLAPVAALLNGSVFGPGASTDNAITRWDGTDGLVLQNSGVIIDDSNNVTGVVALTLSGTLTANGDVALGSDGADTITVNGNVLFPSLTAGAVLFLSSLGAVATDSLFAYNDSTNVLSVQSLTIAEDTIIGSASDDLLTINAGTWTIGSDYIATRASGALAAGVVSPQQHVISASANAAGTTDLYAWTWKVEAGGTQNFANVRGHHVEIEHTQSGVILTSAIVHESHLHHTGGGNITAASMYNAAFEFSGNAALTLLLGYNVGVPSMSGAGGVTTYAGFRTTNIGNSRITNAIAVSIADITGSTNMYGIVSGLTAGATKWNLYINGTAQNAIAGNLRVGSSTAPTVPLDVTGQANFSDILLINIATKEDISPTGSGQYAKIQLWQGTEVVGLSAFAHANDATSLGLLVVGKTRSATAGTNTILQANDYIGGLLFRGADGTNYINAAQIRAAVDGTPGTNDMPGRLEFLTTADGSTTLTERLRIGKEGGLTVPEQTAPGTPASGSVVMYAKTDGLMYSKDDAGTETALGGSGGSALGKNCVINGDFMIWQRGTSFAAIASAAYFADMWVYSEVSDAVHTISRSTDVPTVAEAGRLFLYSVLVDCTTADASLQANDVVVLEHRIEGYNFVPLAQIETTLSFWVKATKTGTYCVGIRNSAGDRSYIIEYTVNTTATWEFKQATIPASPSAGTWDYTTGTGLRIAFCLMGGTTYATAAGSWTTGNYLHSANQVNACDSTANDFRITGVQLEAGASATDFEYVRYVDALHRCHRYYRTWGGINNYDLFPFPAQVTATTGGIISVSLSPPMRIAPTVTVSAATDWNMNDGSTSAECNALALGGAVNNQPQGVELSWGSATATFVTGRIARLSADNTASARINFNASL